MVTTKYWKSLPKRGLHVRLELATHEVALTMVLSTKVETRDPTGAGITGMPYTVYHVQECCLVNQIVVDTITTEFAQFAWLKVPDLPEDTTSDDDNEDED